MIPTPFTVFIKTCKRDLPWLKYCLRSLDFIQGVHERILIADHDCQEIIDWKELVDKLIFIPTPKDGYLGQQLFKITAHYYARYEHIVYMDSDAVFTKPVNLEAFRVGNKTIWGYRHHSTLVTDSCYPILMEYHNIVKREIGADLPYEFNQFTPPAFRRSTLTRLHLDFPDILPKYLPCIYEPGIVEPGSLLNWLKSPHGFNEFNIMGQYAFQYEHDDYYWMELSDPKAPRPEQFAKFYWSWNGLNDTTRQEIETILGDLKNG